MTGRVPLFLDGRTDALRRIPDPDEIPAGMAVYHNHVQPTRVLGSRGFRAYLYPVDTVKLIHGVPCDCGWAPELPTHYRAPVASDA
jgi:hypothetical protein